MFCDQAIVKCHNPLWDISLIWTSELFALSKRQSIYKIFEPGIMYENVISVNHPKMIDVSECLIRNDRKFSWPIICTDTLIHVSILKNHKNAWDSKAYSLIGKIPFPIISSNESKRSWTFLTPLFNLNVPV